MKKIGVLIDYENQATYNDFLDDEVSDEDVFVAILHLTAVMQGRGVDLELLLNEILDTLEEGECIVEDSVPRLLN